MFLRLNNYVENPLPPIHSNIHFLMSLTGDFRDFVSQRPEYLWLYVSYRESVKDGTRQAAYALPADRSKVE